MPLSHGQGIQVPGISYTDISGYTDILGMPLSHGQGSRHLLHRCADISGISYTDLSGYTDISERVGKGVVARMVIGWR